MVISLNGLGWQTAVQQQQRVSNEAALADFMPVRPPVATSTTSSQQNSQGSTTQQNAEQAREEAFAKLKVLLQNPDEIARQQASVGEQEQGSAVQEFRDYMALTPEEKIQQKVLQELGLTVEEYNAMPPEQKAVITEQIAQRVKEEVQIKTEAKLQQQAQSTAAANPASDAATAQQAEQRKEQLDVMLS